MRTIMSETCVNCPTGLGCPPGPAVVASAPELAAHLDVMARWSLHLAFDNWTEDAWENHFPEIGEHDFERIMAAAEKLLPPGITVEQAQAAHAFFEGRATE